MCCPWWQYQEVVEMKMAHTTQQRVLLEKYCTKLDRLFKKTLSSPYPDTILAELAGSVVYIL
jgi:hypothetical protein